MLLFVAAPRWVLLDAREDGKAALVQSSPGSKPKVSLEFRSEAWEAVANAVGGAVSLIQCLCADVAKETMGN